MQSLINDIGKLDKLNEKYKKLCELLTYEEILLDKKLCLKYEKEKHILEPIILNYEEYKLQINNVAELNEMLTMVNSNEKAYIQTEIEKSNIQVNNIVKKLNKQLIELNAVIQNVVVEIVATKDELSIKLLNLLVEAYTNFCKNNGLGFIVENLKNITKINITGLNAKTYFEDVIGEHVAKLNDNQSSCFVYVYNNELQEDFGFTDDDIEITSTRSNGAGGQHVNTTDSAIKVTHKKSGVTATCQNERSQLQNKNKAIETLKQRVAEFYKNKNLNNVLKQKKEQQKLFKTNNAVRIYDYNLNKIITNKKETLNLSEVVLGKIL